MGNEETLGGFPVKSVVPALVSLILCSHEPLTLPVIVYFATMPQLDINLLGKIASMLLCVIRNSEISII